MKSIKNDQGFVLITVILVITLASLLVASVVLLSRQQVILARVQMAKDVGFYAADAGIQMARFRIENGETGNFTMTVPHMDVEEGLEVTVTVNASGDNFTLVSSTEYLGHERIIEATLQQGSPSDAFNYAYFISTWAWWYSNGITAFGDVHSNGPFTFGDYRPLIKGGDISSSMYIHNNPMGIISERTRIRQNQRSVRQQGTSGFYHPYTAHVEYPNPRNVYARLESAGKVNGTVTIGGEIIISGDTVLSGHQNVYLEGTEANPIVVDGIVFVPGDVIIKGPITGQGTIFSGRNTYFAGDTTYVDPPTARNTPLGMSHPPATGLVEGGAGDDMVYFSSFNHILLGDVMDSFWEDNVMEWVNNPLNESDENVVGKDGIPGTEDDGPYDVDGSGTIDGRPTIDDFRFSDPLHFDYFWGLPEDEEGFQYSDIIDGTGLNNIQYIDGVLHSGRFIAGGGIIDNALIFGAFISRYQALFYLDPSYVLEFQHDKRLHSRYQDSELLRNLLEKLGILGTQTAASGIISWNEVR